MNSYKRFYILIGFVFCLYILSKIFVYFSNNNLKFFLENSTITTGKVTRYNHLKNGHYYLYFYKVGDKYFKAEEHFNHRVFPNFRKNQTEKLDVYVLYATEGHYRSMLVLDSFPKIKEIKL